MACPFDSILPDQRAGQPFGTPQHIMATVQLRNLTEGRAYYDRKKASGQDVDGVHAVSEETTVRTSSTGTWSTTPCAQ